jgi:hypothetical protein
MQSVTIQRMGVARGARGARFGTNSFGIRSQPHQHHGWYTPRAASPDKEQTSDIRTPDTTVSFDSFVERLGRYDFLSAGLPSLAVVSVFVAKGQDPWKALSIAFCATVLSVVANEFLFDDDTDDML